MNLKIVTSFTISILLFTCSGEAQEMQNRKLFDFDSWQPSQWQIVNDGVMGGLSRRESHPLTKTKMRFSGNLSLRNNGGFASVRSRPKTLNLSNEASINIRVKGDGRTYTLNLYVPTRRTAFSYQQTFPTKAGEWVDLYLPITRFQAKSFGRPVNRALNASEVTSIGILLGDKKPGAFDILVDKIEVANPVRK